MTAYSTLEEDVFIAPCVVTTNDNFMGRTEKRKELMKGPTIRRGARIGGGAILCPGDRDRRGGVRRRRRGRDEGRAAARRRRRLAGPRPARRRPGRAQGERRLSASARWYCTGSGVARRPASPPGSRCRASRTRKESRTWRPTRCESASRTDRGSRPVDVVACPAPRAASRTFAARRRRQAREEPLPGAEVDAVDVEVVVPVVERRLDRPRQRRQRVRPRARRRRSARSGRAAAAATPR